MSLAQRPQKPCTDCRTPFEPTSNAQKRCPACRLTGTENSRQWYAQRKQDPEWRAKRREANTASARKRRAAWYAARQEAKEG